MWKGTLLHEVTHLPQYLLIASQAKQVPHRLSTEHYGQHRRQYLQILTPLSPPKAWVVYWHGGGWQFGSPQRFRAAAYPWLAAGYGVIMPSYRRIPRYNYDHIRQDTIDALRLARQKALGGSELPFVFMGMSAGGHIASLAATDRMMQQEVGWSTGQIAGCVALGAVLNMNTFWLHPTMVTLAGIPSGKRYDLANPFNHLQGNECPFLIVHGTKDGMVPFKSIEQYRDKYCTLNGAESLSLITIPEGTHLDAGLWLYSQNDIQEQVSQTIADWVK